SFYTSVPDVSSRSCIPSLDYPLTLRLHHIPSFFSFTTPSPTHTYPLPLHDALPISPPGDAARRARAERARRAYRLQRARPAHEPDRKSTGLNSSHRTISYAVFCLKKKKKKKKIPKKKKKKTRLKTPSKETWNTE